MATNQVIFELEAGEDWTEVNMVSFVDNPAIRTPFLKFNEHHNPFKFQAQEDRRIVTGPVLIPDLIIPRKIENVLFNVVFREEQIAKIYDKFMASGSFQNTNFMHQAEMSTANDCYLYEVFLADPTRGVMAPQGFEDLPTGTWYMSYKITSDALWNTIKEGKVNGYSIEGNFKMMAPSNDPEADEIMNQLEEIAQMVENSQKD